jgi:hypothetical protein
MHSKFWPENLKEGHHSEDTDIDKNITLKWLLEK